MTSFGNTPLGTPQNGPPKYHFCLAQTSVPVLFFDINRYNKQIFRHSLRVPLPLGTPQSGPPQIKFCTTKFTVPVFFISLHTSEANILTEFESTTPRGPPKRTPKHQFFQQLKLEFYFLFDIMKHCKDKLLDIL